MKKANETSAASFGLGAALAVAYDLSEDPVFTQPQFAHQETTSVPLTSVPTAAQSAGVFIFSKNGYYPPITTHGQPAGYQPADPYWAVNGYNQPPQQSLQMPATSAGVPMTAYLNPIPVSSPSPARAPDTGTYFLSTVPQHPQQQPPLPTQHPSERLGYLDVGPPSESTLSTDSMLSIRSDTMPSYQPTEVGYTIKPAVPQPIMPNTVHNAMNSNQSSLSVSSSRRQDDQRQAAVPSTGSDDGLYELSEEDVRKIDDTLTQNPQVTSSRHWKYYVETNEWTRATCALMACLFSRDQMANSTVLGRGGSQRERLPTNLVAYVVTKMRRRFNKSAAAVRARMAQKCKDERRFGRLLPSGVIATNTDRSQPAAATSMRHSTSSRRRSAAATNGDASAANTSLSKSARLSAAIPTHPPEPYGQLRPHQLPPSTQTQPPSSGGTSAPLVPDPPVILASGHEMAS